MQTTSDLYDRIVANPGHWFETKVNIAGVDFAESSLFSMSTSIGLFSGDPEIGKAIAGEINLRMINPEIDIPRRAPIKPYVRACAIENGATISSEWLPKGIYFIDTREITKNSNNLSVLILHGYDAMLFAEQDYSSTELNWPATDIDIITEIAGFMGVQLDSRTVSIVVDGYTLSLPASYSLREVLGYIASMYVGSFIMSDEGKLRLVSVLDLPTETNYLINEEGLAITFGGDRILV